MLIRNLIVFCLFCVAFLFAKGGSDFVGISLSLILIYLSLLIFTKNSSLAKLIFKPKERFNDNIIFN